MRAFVISGAVVFVIASACYDLDAVTGGGGPCVGAACDGGSDVVIATPETGAPDAAVECKPGDSATFKPKWRPPTGNHQNRCSSAQITTIANCFFNAIAGDPSCREFLNRSDNANCMNCVLSDYDDDAYGPLIQLDEDRILVNVEGCAAMVANDNSATGCPAKAQALSQCKRAVCAPYCPLTDNASLKALNKCEDDADATTCNSYLTASSCFPKLVAPGGAAQACVSGTTPLDAARDVVAFFCGQ